MSTNCQACAPEETVAKILEIVVAELRAGRKLQPAGEWLTWTYGDDHNFARFTADLRFVEGS